MGQKNTIAPRLPAAPVEYDPRFMDHLTNVLRLYFTQLDNAAPTLLSSQGVGTPGVVAGLSLAQPDPASPGQFMVSMPTQADLPNLRAGDIFYDTTAYNVLRIKSGSGDDEIPSPYPLIWLNM